MTSIRSTLRGRNDPVSLRRACALAGIPLGKLSMRRTRGLLPKGKLTMHDAMSLRVAEALSNLGLRAEPACAIAFGIREDWPAIIANSATISLYVEATGSAVPYTFALLSPGELMSRRRGSGITVDVSAVAREVLTAALLHRPADAHVQ